VKLAVVGCSELVTLAGPAHPRAGAELRELSIIRDGAMLVRDGRIDRVGPRPQIAIDPDAEIIDAGGRVVMPGFVDAHTHPVFAGNRAGEFEKRVEGATYQEISAAGGGIRSTVRNTRAATEPELVAAANRYATWFLRNGTTTIEAKSGYGLSLDDELKLLRVIAQITPLRTVPTFLGAHEIPDEFRGRRSDYVDLVIQEMLPRAAAFARFCDVFCEPRVFPIADARRVLEAARALGLGLRMHVDQLENSGGAMLAAELGAATADHLEYADAASIHALKSAGVQPVLLPGSVYALGSRRYPDARAMIAAGLAIVLATDFNPGSSPTPSIPMILSLAATQMKMTPAESITASTINAAYSLGLGAEIGSLEPGKRGDFVIHDCADHRELAYFFGIEPARACYIGGKLVFAR
jgi:imidazolonepropionase